MKYLFPQVWWGWFIAIPIYIDAGWSLWDWMRERRGS